MKKVPPHFPFSYPTVSILILIILISVGCGYSQGELNGEVFVVTKGRGNISLGLVTVQAISEDKINEYIAKRKLESKIEIEKLQPEYDKAKTELENAQTDKASAYSELLRRYNLYLKNMSSKKAENYSKESEELAEIKKEIYQEKLRAAATLKVKMDDYKSAEFYFKGLPDPIATAKTGADGRFKLSIQRNKRVALAAHASRQVMGDTEEYYWLIWISLDGKPEGKILLSNDNMTNVGAKDSLIATK